MFLDDEYARRLQQAGLEIRCAQDVFVHYAQSAAFNQLRRDGSYQRLYEKNLAAYRKKWGSPSSATGRQD